MLLNVKPTTKARETLCDDRRQISGIWWWWEQCWGCFPESRRLCDICYRNQYRPSVNQCEFADKYVSLDLFFKPCIYPTILLFDAMKRLSVQLELGAIKTKQVNITWLNLFKVKFSSLIAHVWKDSATKWVLDTQLMHLKDKVFCLQTAQSREFHNKLNTEQKIQNTCCGLKIKYRQ